MNIFAGIYCGWSAPIFIEKGNFNSTYPGLFVSPVNGKKHLFYPKIEAGNHFLCYKSFDDNDTPITTNCMKQEIDVIDITAAGSQDGKNIYVAFSANRTLAGKKCDEKDQSGCKDVYFMESSDEGATWSQIRAVPRNNMNDAVNRVTPKLLYIPESKRLFVFYIIESEDLNSIMQVTRPSGSQIFSNEVEVYHNRYAFNKLQVAYSKPWGQDYIHVMFESLYWLTLLSSTTNGREWLEPKPIRFVTPFSSYVMKTSTMGNMLYIASMDRSLMTTLSVDYEQEIEEIYFRFEDRTGFRPVFAPIPQENGQFVLSGIEKKNFTNYMTTYVYDNGFSKVSNLTVVPPLSPYPDTGIIGTSKEFKLTVLHNDTNSLFMSTLTVNRIQTETE